jgi:hypothetical protein
MSMSAMISIDFGNSFTKVGIRPDRNSESQLAKDGSLQLDDGLNICVPSLVASVWHGGRKQWYYGTDVLQLGNKTPTMKVYRNWKPTFFQDMVQTIVQDPPELVGAATSSGPERRISMAEAKAISDKFGIALAGVEEFFRSNGAVVVPDDKQVVAPDDKQTEGLSKEFLQEVAGGFFRWLRTFIEPICNKRGLADIGAIPVRISLPAFGSQTKAEHLLVDILQESGWKTDDWFPAIAEPISNSIGVFTNGRNATHFPLRQGGREFQHNGRMFGESELFGALRERLLREGQQYYWAMGIDVGGYTADFAMLGFDLDEMDVQFNGKVNDMRRMASSSKAIGVRTLDERVRYVLPDGKQDYLREINDDPDQGQIETFHRKIYNRRESYETGKYGKIGAGAEQQDIHQCIHKFAEEIADYAQQFIDKHQYQRIDALILTGGGCNIPLVRSALFKRLARYRKDFGYAATYVPSGPQEKLQPGHRRLDPYLVRGATALGGASVFFDFAKILH